MRVTRALSDMKFVLIGSVFVVVAIVWVYQTYSSLSELMSEVNLNPELSRNVLVIRLNTTSTQIGIGFLMLAIGLSFVGWGIADYTQRSSNRTTRLLVGSLYMISRRLEKLEAALQNSDNSDQTALSSNSQKTGRRTTAEKEKPGIH
ncbi:MAG: hypothetical protein PHY18_05510 [Dehalococcoidales bacterium]|nr:hypothetical protein [Dehalococcoidales bacterium]